LPLFLVIDNQHAAAAGTAENKTGLQQTRNDQNALGLSQVSLEVCHVWIGHKAFKSNAGLVHEQLLIGGFGCQSRQEQTGNKCADENCAKNVYEMDIRVR